MEPRLFFSIVVPAHNEERYLEATLADLAALEYPEEKREVIVIENGSGDRTLEIAKKFEGKHVQLIQSAPGVSRAKNAGIDALSLKSDWVVFLDADTLLEKNFLNELDAFLRGQEFFAVGTTFLRPLPDTRRARAWFLLYNLGHRIQKTSLSISIARRSLFPALRFDENLRAGEDLALIKAALRSGKFFFLKTRGVSTSTRRFEAFGWLQTSLYLAFGGLMPVFLRRKLPYEVVQ